MLGVLEHHLSIYHTVCLLLIHLYLSLSAQFFILFVCALHVHSAHTFRKLLKKIKSTNLFSGLMDKCVNLLSRGLKFPIHRSNALKY